MQEALTLALDFLDEHPDAALRILEQHDAQQVAAFLDTVPESYAVLALGRTLPAFAAHLCLACGSEMSARLLLQQDVGRMVAVLRHVDHGFADAILAECPTARRQACLVLLHYPVRCVGAWIVPDVAVVASDFTVAETLKFLKDANPSVCTPYVFAVSRDGRPEGRISHLALLQAHVDQRIEWLMDKQVDSIPAHMPVAQAAKLPGWHGDDVMPVIGAQQQFIGALRHADLRQALHQHVSTAQQAVAGDEPLSGLAEAYGQSLLALFGTVSTAVESELKS
jgi:Mg/Co/Ni transporter MgtE